MYEATFLLCNLEVVTFMEDTINDKKKLYPFHMPGHKRNKNFIDENLLELDMTEICGLDNLHNPKGIIKNAQENCAKIFGARQSFFVVNGASSAVMAAIFSVCNENDEIIAMRSSHKSFYNALELMGIVAYYLYGKDFFGINCGIDYGELENLLKEKDAVKAVFITSPNYEGFCLDIKKICEIVHRYKKILIVDEAHGSHFVFHEKFPTSALKSGADIVINSLHKTLLCLTQSAVLHINSELVDIKRVKKYLSMFQTTSPSYILMSVMDSTLRKLHAKNFYDSYIEKLIQVRKTLSSNKIIQLVEKNDCVADIDISKLVFLVNAQEKPQEVEEILRNEFDLQIEMCGLKHFVALSTIADTDFGFQLLIKSIGEIEKRFRYKKLVCRNNDVIKPNMICSIKNATKKTSKYVLLDESLNKISASYITPYPPGIPLIVPGEMITLQIINCVKYYLEQKIEVLGVNENMILVIS